MKILLILVAMFLVQSCAMPLKADDFAPVSPKTEAEQKADKAECEAVAAAYQQKTGFRNVYLSSCMERNGYALKR